MKGILLLLLFVFAVVLLAFASGGLYVIDETKQVVITQFGQPIGDPITDSGLHFKLPFVQAANYFEKRLLEWDGDPDQINTKDRKFIMIDTTARWRIVDALKFMRSAEGREERAHTLLDDVIESKTMSFIRGRNLVEVIRDSNVILDEKLDDSEASENQIKTELASIKFGRNDLTRGILAEASKEMMKYGIELVDVRIKRINYDRDTQRKVFERMISERKRAAAKLRSEGQGKKAEIEGRMLKELNSIRSEAYKVAEEVKGNADAEAIQIYADAYNRDPDFYAFVKTLDTYKNTVDENTVAILSTSGEYFTYLKNASGKAE